MSEQGSESRQSGGGGADHRRADAPPGGSAHPARPFPRGGEDLRLADDDDPHASSTRPTIPDSSSDDPDAGLIDLGEHRPLANGGGGGGGGGGGEAGSGSSSARPRSKSGTNFDTIIGKIVVDQGLATPEELQACMDLARSGSADGSAKSLTALLIENEFITRRQLDRIRVQAEAERSGQQIPGYKILGKLGAGAMATVFKARQLSLDRLVAIKVLPRKYSENKQFIERFYAEGKAAAQLNHPHIVQAYDVGQAGEYHYFVMEFVDGRTVYDDIVKNKRYSERDALDVAIQVAEALAHAHAKGLVHRDVKPKNIMLNKDGVVKLADMGLARAISDKEAAEAEQGKAFGTPYYISPEQIRGELKIGPPADIYSLGATLYHMVTGNVPFDGKNPSAVMHKHLKAELVPPDHANPKLTAGISEVIEMMMAKHPRDRYQSCDDLLTDLRAVRAGKTPSIAHRDLLDAAALQQQVAAAAAAAEIPVDSSAAPDATVPRWQLILVTVLLVISVIVNVVVML
ncbi:MAG: serine/threonine protein kinase [Phycisphaeraceae bacterium]|nr:serine/threonine protein kinase [Phycisphaeraceae bacterium]